MSQQLASLATMFDPPPPANADSANVADPNANENGPDEQLPAHKRRRGRMESLHEFHQRAMSYHELDEAKRSPPPLLQMPSGFGDHFLDISTTPHGNLQDLFLDPATEPTPTPRRHSQRASLVASDYTDGRAGLRHRLLSHCSSSSLFGNPRNTSKSRTKFYRHQAKVLAFLVLLGVIGGPLHYSLRLAYGKIAALRRYLIGLTDSSVEQYLLWAAHTVFFTLLGVVWTRLAPVASGSGISQMKSILTGIDVRMYLPGYFDLSTLVAKLGGLVCAVGAGLVVGTEGAFVHIMSIVTHLLLRTRFFAGFSDRLNARVQLLAAACGVGVASTFSSPIGGVLFSMEVTATYYLISNYMKAFISSVAGAVMLQVTLALADSKSPERGTSIFKSGLPDKPFQIWELPLFTLMGACVGVVAYLMIVLLRVVAVRRKKLRASHNKRKKWFVTWVDPFLVAILVATLSFWAGEFARAKSIDDLTELFTGGKLPATWLGVSKFYSLSVLCAMYAVLLPLCITLQLPTGVWLPTFIAGAAFGRLFGESLLSIGVLSTTVVPGAYALAGAAAFAGAATGTVSAAVITLEITGSMPLMLPIFCATLASIGVCNLLPEDSVYDTLLVVSGLPYLPVVEFEPTMVASDVVEPLLVYVTKRTTVAKLLLAVQRMPVQDIPVVSNEFDMRLLGLVSAANIRDLIRHYYETNALPDVDVDLGDAMASTKTPPTSWTNLATKLLAEPNHNSNPGGFYGQQSYNHIYHALATTVAQPEQAIGGGAGLPFLMNDERMIALMSEGWSETKRDKLELLIKLSYGNFCVLKPTALTVSSATPLEDLHMIFTMMRCDHCYVCEQGALVGVVTTQTLLQAGALTKTST